MPTFDSPGVVASRVRLSQAARRIEAEDVQASLTAMLEFASILADNDPHQNTAAALARDWGMSLAEARRWAQQEIDRDRLTLARLTGERPAASLQQRVAPDLSYCKAKYRGASLEH